MRWTACAAIVILGTLVPSAHGILSAAGNGFVVGSAFMLALAASLVWLWPATDGVTTAAPAAEISAGPAKAGHYEKPGDGQPGDKQPGQPLWRLLLAVTLGLAVVAWVANHVLPAVFAGPPDPNRGDMLVIIDHAITAFLSGGNPYAIHKVPWDAPLSYGPILWLPYVLPHVLQVDVRVLTIAAQCIVPMCLIWAAAFSPPARAIALGALGVALAVNPDILRFHAIGHTQIYWPLLLFFSLSLADRRWAWAAVCLGLLVAARTTMVSLVPVFFIYALVSHGPLARCVVLVGVSAALPFAWFVIADPASVQYAMFGVYLKVMKGFVWYQTTWVQNTYGVTGWLLRRGLERYVEIVQVASLAVVYFLSWRSMKSGNRPEPWLGLALLVFSMTTLWPVSYLYFDVWVLLASGLLGTAGLRFARSPGQSLWLIGGVGAACLIVVLAVGAYRPGASYSLDIGDPATSGFTGGGFGRDVAVADEGRQVVWVEGETARVRVPRAGWRGATIRIAIRPQLSNSNVEQRVSASINGHLLGATTLKPGWQEIEFASRGRDWRYGFNVLDLQFSYAVPSSEDPRPLAAAVDWVAVGSSRRSGRSEDR